MPLGICIINWDAFEGGVVSLKYPEDLKVPDNIVQILQISHNFNPGMMVIKEREFQAISLGNEELQKVIVLVLSKYEDAEDFKGITDMINESLIENGTEEGMKGELKRLMTASDKVFRARETVMIKLANEISELKNREIDIRTSLEWLYKNEESWKKRIIFLLMIHGKSTSDLLLEHTKLPKKEFFKYLHEMENDKMIKISEQSCELIIRFNID
jgi:hypothetical protein